MARVYLIIGTDREVGALGISDPFAIYIEATNPRLAADKARDARYRRGREHVHVTSVRERVSVHPQRHGPALRFTEGE